MFVRFIRGGGLAGLLLLLSACASSPHRPTPLVVPAAASATKAPRAAAPAPSLQAVPRQPVGTASDLAARIDAFIAQPRFANATWGIDIVDPRSGRVRYAHNANKLVVPASNVKLYTTALALATLGANARFTTTLYATKKPRSNGLLAGDLILYGRGDPSLGDANVAPDSLNWADRFAVALVRQGVTRVKGDLIADDTYYQGSGIGGGWEAGDLQQWYAPRVSALSVQGDVMTVQVTRAGSHGSTVSIMPAHAALIVNLTHEAGAGEPLRIFRRAGNATVYVSGSLPPGADSRRFVLAAPDPALMAGYLLRDALASHGIALSGQVRALHWPAKDTPLRSGTAHVIAQISSPPLSTLIDHTLKHSDNLYAQNLLLQVGVDTAHGGVCTDRAAPPRTTQGWGLCAMRAMLRRAGIGTDQATFVEGAGLSRKDLATPAATTSLLVWITRQPFGDVILDALPVAGVDGTLVYRLRNTLAEDNLRAKTGTLTHAYALSGFVTDAAGRPLVFSLTLNHYQRPRDAFGRIVQPSPTHDLDVIANMLAEFHGTPAAQSAQGAQTASAKAGIARAAATN